MTQIKMHVGDDYLNVILPDGTLEAPGAVLQMSYPDDADKAAVQAMVDKANRHDALLATLRRLTRESANYLNTVPMSASVARQQMPLAVAIEHARAAITAAEQPATSEYLNQPLRTEAEARADRDA